LKKKRRGQGVSRKKEITLPGESEGNGGGGKKTGREKKKGNCESGERKGFESRGIKKSNKFNGKTVKESVGGVGGPKKLTVKKKKKGVWGAKKEKRKG